MMLEEVREWVQKQVSPARFRHILGVNQILQELAKRWDVDQVSAEWAAILHDVCRDLSGSRLLNLADKFGIVKDEFMLDYPILLHGPVAAELCRHKYQISQDIYLAICHHTWGRPRMGRLEQLLFLADAIEPNRNYPVVDKLRILAFSDLPQALLETLSMTIIYTVQQDRPLHYFTVEARNDLLKAKASC